MWSLAGVTVNVFLQCFLLSKCFAASLAFEPGDPRVQRHVVLQVGQLDIRLPTQLTFKRLLAGFVIIQMLLVITLVFELESTQTANIRSVFRVGFHVSVEYPCLREGLLTAVDWAGEVLGPMHRFQVHLVGVLVPQDLLAGSALDRH